MTNTCSGCTACCHTVPVKEIGLKAYQRCPHERDWLHAKGPGCGIYATRPRSCAVWSCMYIKSDWAPNLRPDRLGLIVDEAVDIVKINRIEYPAAQIWVLPGHEDDWQNDDAHDVIRSIIEGQKLAVLWRLPGGKEAIVFWRNPKTNRIERSAPHLADKLNTLGPDSERLLRAGKLYAQQQDATAVRHPK